jgi:hypothetical protein
MKALLVRQGTTHHRKAQMKAPPVRQGTRSMSILLLSRLEAKDWRNFVVSVILPNGPRRKEVV